ncbi:MAG TPA: hypothetical protein GXX14_10815 [Clostridiaceae bacterium]|nr:hypothetical protein [Clostridiaceae bacterium]
MKDIMTVKERMLAAIRMEPLDRLPFWPKLSEAYTLARKSTCKGMSLSQIYDWIGSDRQEGIDSCIIEKRTKTSFEVKFSGNDRVETFSTKYGDCTRIWRFDKASQSYHPVKMPVESVEDIKRMIEYYNDCAALLDRERLENSKRAYEAIGDKALVVTFIGESPLMDFIENLAGIEKGHYFLFDYTELVEELFEAMQKCLLERVRLIAEYNPADMFYMVENTSTTLISPQQFRNYCIRHIREYEEIIDKHERILALHMCGHLKDLLPDLAKLSARVFEAFTSPTVGNTTLLDGRKSCPDKCLFGGTNAILWTKTGEEIIEQLKIDLGELPHHRGIIVSSAGVMPPSCEPEVIKKVSDFIKDYPVRL